MGSRRFPSFAPRLVPFVPLVPLTALGGVIVAFAVRGRYLGLDAQFSASC